MEGDPVSSPRLADALSEGNTRLSIQADSEILTIPIVADTGIPTRADEVNQFEDGISRPADKNRTSIASQPDADTLSFSFHADEGTLNRSTREDSSIPSSSSFCVSVHAHLKTPPDSGAGSSILISARADLAQETNFLENSPGTQSARAKNPLLNFEDVATEDGVEQGEFLDNSPEETPVAFGKLENGASALEKASHDAQAYDHDLSNEEFLAIGNVDDHVTCDKDTGLLDGKRCNGEESNLDDSVPMQEHDSWNEGFIDDLATVPEPQGSDRRSSLKRSRSSNYDDTPCVQVIYRCLTSESKTKLKDFMQQWAQWHSEFVRVEAIEKTPLESGDETYFPPLQVGQSRTTMSFWMDKPSKQARTETAVGDSTPVSQAREKEVPLYDRAGTGALLSHETGASLEGDLGYANEGSRCFNCGSYSHSMKECPRPRDNTAINNARKLLAEKRGSANGSRTASRYYQSSPGGKFDDLKPGFLGTETRQLLGIGERDPPPWLHRMRELGYPPGYLEDQEEEQSGIIIFGTSDDAEGNFIGEEGEMLGESAKKSSSSAKKMVVHFPGVNAPIPDDADQRSWGSFADRSGHEHAPHRIGGGRNAHPASFSAAAVASDGTVYTGTESWEGPPGASSRDSYSRSSGAPSPGFEGASMYSSTPPAWQANEQGRSGKAPAGRSPYLGRSSSDSGRRSPRRVAHEEPYSLPPLGGRHSSSRHSPLHSSRAQVSPASAPSQRYPYDPQQGREEDSRRRAWSHAHDALQSLHRHHDRHHSPARRR